MVTHPFHPLSGQRLDVEGQQRPKLGPKSRPSMLSHRGHYFSSARTWMPAERLSCDLKAERLLDHPLLVASREEIDEGGK